MKVHCKYDELVSIEELKRRFHPRNPNDHPQDQIEDLAEILKYQGIRSPAKISNLSEYLTAGHGRVLAAEFIGWTHYPVNFQDYDDEAQEYADLVADNAIASRSKLKLKKINAELPEVGPLNIRTLGIKKFTVDPSEKEKRSKKPTECPECGYTW